MLEVSLMSDFTTEATTVNQAILAEMAGKGKGKGKGKGAELTRVVVGGSYMFNPQPGWLAKLLRTELKRENLDGVEVRTSDSKGVAAAAQGMVEQSSNLKGRVFVAKDEDGAARWALRTERMLKGAARLVVLTTGKQGVDNNEAAYLIQAAKKAAIPVTVHRV